jgi:hypothetical protein
MAKRDDLFPSKYLKAADLKGRPLVVEIAEAPTETFKTGGGGEDRKTVLHFHGGRVKPLPLNMTNWDAVADIAGDDTDRWPGTQIEVFPTTTEMKGKIVDCIRIRPTAQREFAWPPATGKPSRAAADNGGAASRDDMDDTIPF